MPEARLSRWLSTALLWLLLCGGAAQAVAVRDDRGATVDLPKAPRRIVSLLPALSEIVCELGACDRLVGVDNYSNWPAALQRLPRTSGMEDANVELIVSLRPDVVLLSASSRLMERLQAFGIAVLVIDPTTMADVQSALRRVAWLLQLPDAEARAQALWQREEAGLLAAAASVPARSRGQSVYFEVDGGPYAAGAGSFMGQILQRLGLRNIVPADLGAFPKLNPEFVVRADPQIIMLSEHSDAALSVRPGWSRLRAVQTRQICEFNAAQGDVLVRPGPRMDQAAWLIVACLQRLDGAARR